MAAASARCLGRPVGRLSGGDAWLGERNNWHHQPRFLPLRSILECYLAMTIFTCPLLTVKRHWPLLTMAGFGPSAAVKYGDRH